MKVRQALYYTLKELLLVIELVFHWADSYPLVTLRAGLQSQILRLLSHKEYIFIRGMTFHS